MQDGVLAPWEVLPLDGDACIRLTVLDKVGNRTETKVNITIDTHPPETPVLSGNVENQADVRLNWSRNQEPDLTGYILYRNDQKVNLEAITDVTYLDQNLDEGTYTYTVRTVDLAGWESEPSNEVRLAIDVTGPDTTISSPRNGARVGDLVEIKGKAFSTNDFKQYRVSIGQGPDPSTWTLIRTSPLPVSSGTLAQWDTLGLGEDIYSIKLEAEDITGNISTDQIAVSVDHTPPVAPTLISATPAASNVTMVWETNTEPDLAGYLLYRNGQLANASGLVIDNLSPYLISDVSYFDKTLPDGKFTYYLVAMDEAGNISDSSNSLDVVIDTHPPQAEIIEPSDGSAFEHKILVKAESADLDIVSVQFQYKSEAETGWIDLDETVTMQPYVTNLDPVALGITYGNYHLRAVATDVSGQTDPSPAFITVTYTDLTAPQAPEDLKVLTNGGDVTLTWTANTEGDLEGYNIYRSSEGTRIKVNTSVITVPTYQDVSLTGGMYTYEVTAVDVYGNESESSNSDSAHIYTPFIQQPSTPIAEAVVRIEGSYAEAEASVEIFVETDSGPVSQGTTESDSEGNFVFDVPLAPGENRITVRVTDGDGNISNISNMVVVLYDEPPSAPTGLMAAVQDYTVNLTWNPNPESDLAGYNLYRDDQQVNAPEAVSSGTTSALLVLLL